MRPVPPGIPSVLLAAVAAQRGPVLALQPALARAEAPAVRRLVLAGELRALAHEAQRRRRLQRARRRVRVGFAVVVVVAVGLLREVAAPAVGACTSAVVRHFDRR